MIEFILKVFRKIYINIFGKKYRGFFNTEKPEFNGQASSDLIYNVLKLDKPCMISRFGNTEFTCVYQYKVKNEPLLLRYKKFIIGDIDTLDYTLKIKQEIQNNAGFFPASKKNLNKFSELIIAKIKNIDILGSWLEVENKFNLELKNTRKVGLEDLNPYNHKIPWSRILKGKKVLVIHPFTKSIESQYKKREKLFKNKEVLPEFNLITYKPVVSIIDNHKNLPFKDWFEALSFMKKDIEKIDFDIAILGCGAYGLPLASYIKEIGKKAVHIGGSTQMLFGILGKRWETEYDLSHIINENWVRPLEEEIPKNFKKIENGCYW
ncbi:hypothetical protein H9W90_03810 [Polaribacter pectinis]|uniref:Uncharacterized protein n=1 Tax=Polaribacter pectinis TaxID=2738844 RepID=A0A7G9LCA7_9FLAO|nr:hypothetical protein [Polaribacter pectinis]QNM86256.1 hypothetical protein H9W90_03810 [Polaribacter pectinis]